MKEFVEQLKLYKEYVVTFVALLGGCLFVLNYFATKDALTITQNTLNRVVDERECWLNNRITISEVSAAIANLEREKLEKTKLKIELMSKPKRASTSVEQMYMEEQLKEITKDFLRINEDLKDFRVTSRVASENLFNRACAKMNEVKK